MSTTAQQIYDQAVGRSQLNDAGATAIASDLPRFFDELNRLIWGLYADAAAKVADPETERNDALAEVGSVVLGGSFVALSASYAGTPVFRTAGGSSITVVTQDDLGLARAELPPAILFRLNQVKSAGRSGDPLSGDTLSVEGTVKPGTIANLTDYIGAQTPATPGTSYWPQVEHVGNDYLIDGIAAYFATRAGDRTDTELKTYADRMAASYQRVFGLLRTP